MVRARSAVRGFQLYARNSKGEFRRTDLKIVCVPGGRDSEYTLIHLLEPAGSDGKAYRLPDPDSERIDSAARDRSSDTASASHPASSPLTPRENEVLAMLARGSSTCEISEVLCISVSTVRNHVQHILHKLAVHSKVEAVSLAHRKHLV
jgi:DNA-binding CsgD family transcriptional regulator